MEPFIDYLNVTEQLRKVLFPLPPHVGAIVVAGGQGSRLGYEAPKGCFPISPIRHKSLFQLFAERTLAAGRLAGTSLPLAIMTSEENNDDTKTYFAQNNNFGLGGDQLALFPQKSLPFLDNEGHPIDDVRGPDGNGWCLKYFYEAGLWHQWHKQGIRYVTFSLIDNALADPFDRVLVNEHIACRADITAKSVLRRDPYEKVGIFVKVGGRLAVVEYSEMAQEELTACNVDGTLKHPCANLSLLCINMDFIERCQKASLWEQMPLHRVYKPFNGGRGWKGERYIFDLLPLAFRTAVLLYPRESCFAPLKESSAIASVQAALMQRDHTTYQTLTGVDTPEGAQFELAPAFHYPTPALLDKWRGVPLPSESYIEP